MRLFRSHAPSISLPILLLLLAWGRAAAQDLPRSATPRGVVVAFLGETASDVDTIDRKRFETRFLGEMAEPDVRSWRGLLPSHVPYRIDSIPRLPEDGGGPRTVAYVSVGGAAERETWSLFCRGDSIWKIEALRRYPSPEQRSGIARAILECDTSSAAGRLRCAELHRFAFTDDSLGAILRGCRRDLDRVVGPLEQGRLWHNFALDTVDFTRLEEYRELDDDITDSTRQFYTLDGRALERLKSQLGVISVERRSAYPGVIALVVARYDGGSIGYLRAADPALLPAPSPTDYVLLRPVAPGWWMYRCLVSEGA